MGVTCTCSGADSAPHREPFLTVRLPPGMRYRNLSATYKRCEHLKQPFAQCSLVFACLGRLGFCTFIFSLGYCYAFDL